MKHKTTYEIRGNSVYAILDGADGNKEYRVARTSDLITDQFGRETDWTVAEAHEAGKLYIDAKHGVPCVA